MLKRLPFFLLILFALFACKTKPAPEEIAAAEDMRTQAVEAQEKALSAEADQKAAELWQQGVDALAAGDEAAAAAVSTMCEYLGRALALIAAVVDPEAFVLGGGVSNSASQYLDELYAAYRRYALAVCADTPIEIASLGNDAGIFGAAYMALRAAEA